ncbi:PKD-like family lipoprotein [Pedobacter frigiditerrae]|uniref:PKD-like family lipoprotein n=1 Tax=Pedobacter frigiditerrae TaxID=2530452 RepID=UPI00292D3EF2|nr:PKD-like family lipoprotein [Pedobacter frigiditerrae]
MKILKYIVLCSTIFIICCKKDKGNYDYVTLEQFGLDTVGLAKSFNVQQGRELLVIDRKLVAADTTDYTYVWRLFEVKTATLTRYDTVSTKRKISTLISAEPGTSNVLELKLTQKSTGLFKFYSFNVTTVSAIPDGFLAVYDKDGSTDVDLIRGTNVLGMGTNIKDTVYRNVLYGGLGGKLLGGTPVSIAANANGVYIATSTTGINQFKNNSFTLLQNQQNMFLGNAPSILKPQYVYNHSASFTMYINNGTVYWGLTSTAPGFIGPSILTVNNTEVKYDAAPFIVYMLGKQGAFFDKINRRFFYQEQSAATLVRFPAVISPAAKFNMDNINKDMIWMGPKVASTAVANSNYRTAYFKDVDGSAKRYLYIMDLTLATSTATNGTANSSVGLIDISALPDIVNAKFFETSYSALNTFYATSTKLYSYFYNGATNSYSNLTNPFTAPVGEEITAIRLLHTTNTNTTMRRMAIATWNSTTKEGKVYMHKIPVPTSGEFDPIPVITSHPGKILQMEAKTN